MSESDFSADYIARLLAATKTLAQTASFCHDLQTTKKGRITCTGKEVVLDDRKDDRYKVDQGSII